MKDKTVAGILAFFLGFLGVHKFYLGQTGLGILYIIFFPIAGLLGIIDGIILLTMDENQFHARFNPQYYYQALAGKTSPQTVIIQTGAEKNQVSGKTIAEQLESLHRLKTIGALTEEEYQVQKERILRAGV